MITEMRTQMRDQKLQSKMDTERNQQVLNSLNNSSLSGSLHVVDKMCLYIHACVNMSSKTGTSNLNVHV